MENFNNATSIVKGGTEKYKVNLKECSMNLREGVG